MLYVYKCETCGLRREIEFPLGRPEKVTCGKCRVWMERVLSMPKVSFVGSGWASKEARKPEPPDIL